MSEMLNSVLIAVKNLKIREELTKVIASLDGFTLLGSEEAGSCDILILDVGDDLTKEFQFVHDLQASGNVGEVFLTSSRSESEVIIQAMRAGAKEFFPQPLNKDEILAAFARYRNGNSSRGSRQDQKKNGQIINIIGSKGGIGTTTVAVNFATSLTALDTIQSVALIDMNLIFGEVPMFLDMEPQFNWGEVAKNITRLDSTYLMSILFRHSSGVYVLPSPTGLDGVNVATPEIIQRILGLMRREFDYIIIDSGQSLDSISLKIMELSDLVLINSILSLPCLINVKRLLETFRRLGYPSDDKVKVIINRYHKNSVISRQEAEKGLGKDIFWFIPNDFHTTISAINQGKTLSAVAGKSEITRNMMELAEKLTNRKEVKKQKRGLFGLRFSDSRS